MKTITFEEASQAGFEPRGYARFRSFGTTRILVDFLADMGGTIPALFYRDASTGERLYASIKLCPDGSECERKIADIASHLQCNDICQITIAHAEHMSSIREIVLIEQAPICAWREQCDQRSPCCVFKS